MPYDPVTGRRAEIVISPETTINRMNYGRIFEHSFKGAMLGLTDKLKEITGLNKDTSKQVYNLDNNKLEACFNLIDKFLEIASEKHSLFYKSLSFKDRVDDLYHVLSDKFYLYRTTDDNKNHLEACKRFIEEGFLSPPRPLRYFNPYTGREEETKDPHRIAPVYYMLLEKISDDAATVATATTRPDNIIARITNNNKHKTQTRRQATRFPGESENRTILGGGPSGLAVELHDRSNNVKAIEAILNNIYSTDTPTNIEQIIDRTKVPLGTSKPLQILKHFGQCGGWEMVYTDFNPDNRTLSNLDPITGNEVINIGEETELDEDVEYNKMVGDD